MRFAIYHAGRAADGRRDLRAGTTKPATARPASRRARTRAPTGTDEELALAAMEGLMAQPPERALPIIKKVLAGSQTTLVKQRALFVLSQIDSPEARRDPGADGALIGCRHARRSHSQHRHRRGPEVARRLAGYLQRRRAPT